jgi:hypothetical protein
MRTRHGESTREGMTFVRTGVEPQRGIMDTQSDRNSGAPLSASRRRMLAAAAAGTGLALLPGAAAMAAMAPAQLAPTIGMGYCRPPASGSIAAATLTDAFSVPALRGAYELRVVGANTQVPLAIAAQYGANAEHCFWQAWTEQSMLQCSPPSAIRWVAKAGNPLPLNINLTSSSGVAQVTAQAGIYVMTVMPASRRQPAWKTLALRDASSGGVLMRLVSRSSGAQVDFPYALFSVRALDAPRRA